MALRSVRLSSADLAARRQHCRTRTVSRGARRPERRAVVPPYGDAPLAARVWLVLLAFLLAVAELVLYEWRRARAADLVGPLRSAIQETLALNGQPEPLRKSLTELRQLLASPDPETVQRLTSTLQEVL